MSRASGEVASNRVGGRKHSAKLCHARFKKQMYSTVHQFSQGLQRLACGQNFNIIDSLTQILADY